MNKHKFWKEYLAPPQDARRPDVMYRRGEWLRVMGSGLMILGGGILLALAIVAILG